MPFAAQGWNYSQATGFSAFNALPAQFQKRFWGGLETLVAFGDAPLGFLRSMRGVNLDFALVKNIVITESKRLQFRAEAFNLATHMVLGAPGTSIAPSLSAGTISYGSAGVVNSIANAPRELQLAMKFVF